MHMTFRHLYKTYYMAYCSKKNIVPVTLEQFYRIRKHFCPNYKKSKTIRPGGWNHIRCDTCDSLRREIMRCEEGTAECISKQQGFLKHMKKQDQCREIYEKKVKKSTCKKYRSSRLSIIVDAAGGAGTKNQPRMVTQEKNEPPRNKMLKTKWTFCVIHGVGTYIYSSYPNLGKQGGNLTLEVIYRGDLSIALVLYIYLFICLF